MSLKLTIGIPFYNNATTLTDSIRSILAQTFQDWELLLVDDGSSDTSLQIANSVNDSRVRIISDGINRGLVYRLNQIVHMAQGQYIARMDGDDLSHPERLAKQVQFLDEHPDVDLVDTAIYSIDQQCNPTGMRGMKLLDTDACQVLCNGLMIHAAVVGRREWFLKYPYDPDYVRAEDHELWCRSCLGSRYARIQEPLYFVREGRVSVKNYLKSQQTQRMIYRKYGPATTGNTQTLLLLLMSHVKGLMYRAFDIFSCHHILVNQRNHNLSAVEAEFVMKTIKHIKAIDLSCQATHQFPPPKVPTI